MNASSFTVGFRVVGPLEPLPAQQLPGVAVRRHVVDPLPSEPRAEGVDGLELGGARPAGEREPRAVGEPVLADQVEGLEVDLPLERATGLAEQVAHDRREQQIGRAHV